MRKFIYYLNILLLIFVIMKFYCGLNVSAYEIDSIKSKYVFETLTIDDEVLIGVNNIYFDDVAKPVNNPSYYIYYQFVDDDFTNIYENSTSLTLAQTRTTLTSYRNQLKTFYSSLKNEIINGIPSGELDSYYFSDYSPFAYRVVHEDEDLNQIIENSYILAANEAVERVYVVQMEYIQTAYIGEDSSRDRYLFEDVLTDCDIMKDDFNGDEINIGIWESSSQHYYFDIFSNDFKNRNITLEKNSRNRDAIYDDNNDLVQYVYNDHGTVVTTIAAGNNGIASESNIFYSTIFYLLYELDWFTMNNVDIVNMSFGLGESYQFTYRGKDYADFVYSHDYTLAESLIDFYSKYARITFVKSAGNRGNEFNEVFLSNVDRITTPGNALNVITVAATNYEGKVAKFSSYESFNDMKPNVVAPGASLSQISESCPNVDSNGITNTGTSFAAPIVTGVIALLMEEFPYLIGNPEAIIAVITASSKQLNTQSELWDSVSGPGLINYNEAREAAENFNRIIVEGEKQNNSVVYEQIIYVDPSSIIEFGLCWSSKLATQEELKLTDTSTYEFNKYTIELYDNTTGTFLQRFNSNWNINIADYYNSSSNISSLKIKVILNDTRSSSDNKDVIFLSYCQKNVVIEETLEFINDEININDIISEEESLIYKINTYMNAQYIFELNANNDLFISLYDEKMNLITDSFEIREDGLIYISEYLYNDYVYLKVQYSSIVKSGDFSLFIRQATYKQVGFNSENDLLSYLYEHTDDLIVNCYFINYQGSSFYEFTVTGSTVDNVPIEFLEGCIKIYADSTKTVLLNEVLFGDYETSESSSSSLIVCLPRDGYYYIEIELNDYEYESINLSVQQTECYNEVNYSNNEILNLLHYDHSSNKKHTTLKYYNNSGAGFYEFKVTGSTTDNISIEFPVGCIKVYADSSKTVLLDEVPFDDYETSGFSNSLFVWLLANSYYYIDIELNDYEYESLNFFIQQTECYNEVNYLNNNILDLIFYDYSTNKKYTTLKYYNNSGAGFYEFTVTGSTNDNVSIEFPVGCIKIYTNSSRTNLLDEVPFEGCEAVSTSNRLFVYLPKNGYYYIEVELNNLDYKYLRFWIEQDEGYTLDLSNNLMGQPFVPLFENCNQDCYFKKVTLSHRCKLILDALTNGIVSIDIPVVIFQQKYDKILGKYYIETVFLNEITSTNRGPEFEVILDSGSYYFGFIDNINNVSITYAIERKINENIDIYNTLVADPYESGCDVGSEVMFNNGSIREYTITEGFTRNLYLLFDGVPTQYSSRLDYDWYSSNDNVAIVTAYGTVLGLNVEEDTEVTIYAIRKSDPSIIYKRTFTILNDLDEEIIEIECDMSYSYSLKNGSYQIQLNSYNSPYPMIQYYSFEIYEWVQEGEFDVMLDYWGRVTATGPGACVIIGTYILNPRVKVIINLVIEE